MRMSASRAACIQRCPREFVYRYELKLPEEKSAALLMGSAWHEMLEGKEPDLKPLEAMDPDYPWADALAAMWRNYHLGFPEHVDEIEREIKIEDERRICIIDGVVQNADGWWIVENKTRSQSISETDALLLPRALQISLYASCAGEIADRFLLDREGWRGVYYVATIKPTERRKKTETKEEFGARMTSRTEVVEIAAEAIVNTADAVIAATWNAGMLALDTFRLAGVEAVPANTASCIRFNSPCPYFAQCHGSAVCEQKSELRKVVR